MGRSEKVTFEGSQGFELAGRLELPTGRRRACALFAHCFTCSKEVAAASRISRALAARGFAVLRFDFTGLGGSDGEFENTNFSSNAQDLVAAAGYLREEVGPPELLIGHSLGGAAVLVAAHDVPECKVVATVGAPYDPAHVKRLVKHRIEDVEQRGRAEVVLAGRTFTITQQFLDDLERQQHDKLIGKLERSLILFHSPADAIVSIENARHIYESAKHPKSFVSLDGADHLLSNRKDADYVGALLAAWVDRYLPTGDADELPAEAHGRAIVRDTGRGKFQQAMRLGPHFLHADEPTADGGDDSGPTPYELLLGALGSCTAMTLRLYAGHKGWPLARTGVYLAHEKRHTEDCEDCERGAKLDHIAREIVLEGDLSDEQRARLIEIADRCPVHRTLHSEIRIDTRERR